MVLGQISLTGTPGVEDAVPALIQALQDEDEWVRFSAIDALWMIGTPEAIEAAEKVEF